MPRVKSPPWRKSEERKEGREERGERERKREERGERERKREERGVRVGLRGKTRETEGEIGMEEEKSKSF